MKVCRQDDNGKHYGEVECAICKNDFKWREGENANVVVWQISLDGANTYLELEVTAKCPHCNYKYKYPSRIQKNEYR
jgi:endogenous inhibitor of DNA gyrase (YacG/DUF329 family)